jgi:hypothetical protein
MIKFRATGEDGREMIGFGITKKNVEKLKEDMPIKVSLDKQMGLEHKIDIVIFYGDSEKEIYKRLKKGGLVSGETEIKVGV